jgi:hypothetical protein
MLLLGMMMLFLKAVYILQNLLYLKRATADLVVLFRAGLRMWSLFVKSLFCSINCGLIVGGRVLTRAKYNSAICPVKKDAESIAKQQAAETLVKDHSRHF